MGRSGRRREEHYKRVRALDSEMSYVMVGGFVALAKAYGFSIPFAGTGISLACDVASIIASLA